MPARTTRRTARKYPNTPVGRYKHFRKKRPNAVGMLLEGDSWFAFPMLLRTNLANEIKKTFSNKIVQLDYSKSGDDAREMLCGKQYDGLFKSMSSKSMTFDAILFSGGGNDIVSTNFPVLLKQHQTGMTWKQCLHKTRFDRRVLDIEHAYQDLADLRADYQKDAIIFTHAYDYAIPTGRGVRILGIKAAGDWVKKRMDDKGIPAGHQQKIIAHMLTRLDEMLTRVAKQRKKWVHIKTQGTLNANEWGDELHPTSKGFKKIAKKFEEALKDQFANLT